MVSIKMSHYRENGILIECNECIVNILKKIKDRMPFEINNFETNINESRKGILELIISVYYRSLDYNRAPQLCKDKVTEALLKHGQFNKEEIDVIFAECAIKSENYSEEFFENNEQLINDSYWKHAVNPFEYQKPKEIQYKFPWYFCEDKKVAGFCTMDIDAFTCPDCGSEVTNTPDNVENIGLSHDLICSNCFNMQDISDTKGIVKSGGNPVHHGNWSSQIPEFEFTGTDYFQVLHPNCRKSERPDKKGVMFVNGIWIDSFEGSQYRVVLGLECLSCGAKNALKPFVFKDREIPVLDVNTSRVFKLISSGETEKIEFKPYLTVPPEGYEMNGDVKYKIAKSISGFMNSDGGVLLIGVSNSGIVLGIDNEYSVQKDEYDMVDIVNKRLLSRDYFALKLIQILDKYIEKPLLKKYVRISFHEIFGKDVCCIKVKKADNLHKFKDGNFYVRMFNGTRALNKNEIDQYKNLYWPSQQ
ncbi:helix-turn-helix domain-containing protein [Methanosarcina sp. UBA411]|jgi:hypothetical protein|uniref:AlbA family DNA-binding domain-containing protein n=1 Tax=Methanosarcina sp. UBA411 TaxID=1915589 RepID=UPI0025E71BE8|nr:ATP-binding protein [Methanosarcina sp. UBA411]